MEWQWVRCWIQDLGNAGRIDSIIWAERDLKLLQKIGRVVGVELDLELLQEFGGVVVELLGWLM